MQLAEQRYNTGKEGTTLIFHTHLQARYPEAYSPAPSRGTYSEYLLPTALSRSPGLSAFLTRHSSKQKNDQRQVLFPLQGPTEAVDLFSVRWMNMYRQLLKHPHKLCKRFHYSNNFRKYSFTHLLSSEYLPSANQQSTYPKYLYKVLYESLNLLSNIQYLVKHYLNLSMKLHQQKFDSYAKIALTMQDYFVPVNNCERQREIWDI